MLQYRSSDSALFAGPSDMPEYGNLHHIFRLSFSGPASAPLPAPTGLPILTPVVRGQVAFVVPLLRLLPFPCIDIGRGTEITTFCKSLQCGEIACCFVPKLDGLLRCR